MMHDETTTEREAPGSRVARAPRANEINAFLARFSDVVRGLSDPRAVEETACRLVAEALRVERAYWADVDWAAREYVIGAAFHAPGVPVIEGRFLMDAWEAGTASHLSGRPHVVHDTQSDARIPPAMREGYAQIAVGADLAVPVVTNGQLRCVLAVNQRLPRHWTPAEVALVHDIAGRCWAEVERARAEAALRRSEERLRLATNAARIATFEIDVAAGTVEFDANVLAVLYGREADAPDRRPQDWGPLVRAWLRPEDAERHAELLRATMRGEGDLHDELLVGDPASGAEAWIETQATLVRDGAGEPDRVVGIMRNITERKRVEAALRASEARQAFLVQLDDALRPLADAAAIQHTAARVLGEHLGATRAMYADVEGEPGAEVGTLRGQYHAADGPTASPPFPERYPYADYGGHVMAFRRSGETMVVADVATDRRFAAAERAAWTEGGVRAAVTVPLVKAGRFVGDFGVQSATPREWTADEVALVEATAERTWAAVERARAEAALRASEEKYRALFEAIDEGFCIVEVRFDDAGKAEDYRFIEVNRAFERQTGIADAAGRWMREIAPDHEEHWFELYGRVATTGEPIRFQRPAEQLHRFYDVYAFPVDEPPVHRVAILFNDITEHRSTDAALRESEARQAFLLTLSDALRAEPDADAVANRALLMLTEHLRLDRCYVSEVFEQQGFSTVGPEQARPDLPPMAGVYRLSDYPETMRQLATRPMVVRDAANDSRFSHAEKDLLAGLHLRALLVTPLRMGERRVIWALAAAMATPRDWTDGERALLEEVAERTWAAVERARAEAAVRESEEKYRTLFETMGQGYCELELLRDADGRVVDLHYLEFNPAFERIFGIPVEQARGRTASEVFPGLEPWWHDSYDRIARAGTPERIEHEVASLGRWYEVWAYPRGGDRLTVLYEDITDRKHTEAARHESEERNRLLVEGARDYAIFTLDVDGRIASWSPGAEAVFGWTEAEALGQPFALTFTPEDRARGEPEAELATARAEGSAPDVRWHQRRDGSPVFIEATTRALRGDGDRPTGYLKVGQDVTESRRLEVERERLAVTEAVAAERQALLKREVLAQEEERRRVAREIHDSVTQLAHAAALTLDDLAERLAPTLPAEDLADLERARDLARGAASDARRLIAGLRPETLDDVGLAGAVAQEVEALRQGGWDVSYRYGDLAGVRLAPEAEITLYRVAQEAFANIRKHTAPTGVGVELRRVDGSVRLRVRDRGPGFDQAEARAGAIAGQHVGLVGMRERLALLGGHLEVRSRPGQGTTLTATLPLPEGA